MSRLFMTIGLLVCSNTFMTYAWHGHLKTLSGRAVWIATVCSWSIALLEYTQAQLKGAKILVAIPIFIGMTNNFFALLNKVRYIWEKNPL